MDSLGFFDDGPTRGPNDLLHNALPPVATAGGVSSTSGGGYDMRRRGRPQWSESSMASSAASSSADSQSETSSTTGGDYDDEEGDEDGADDGGEGGGEGRGEQLPAHACAYCTYHDPLSCAMCTVCNKWFCNGKDRTSGSHLITHLVISKHSSIALHNDGPLGDAPLECYVCGAKNIFSLGFVPSKQESVVVIICREPCLHSQTLRDMEWDPSAWLPLIEEKRLLSWLCSVPTANDRQMQDVRMVTNNEARELETLWKVRQDATMKDFMKGARAEDIVEPLPSIPYAFRDGHHYRDLMLKFVNAECGTSREMTENLSISGLSITWSIGLQRRRIAIIQVPPEEGRISVGDEVMLLQQSPCDWSIAGLIVRMEATANTNNEFHVEVKEGTGADDDQIVSHTSNITLKCTFKAVNFDRQRSALKLLATDETSVSAYLYHAILGQPEGTAGGKGSRLADIAVPDDINAPSIAKLNASQSAAVAAALTRPLTLIQGPPGTGKTSTSATIAYQMCMLNNAQVLICSPSNVAVDQLAARIEQTGLTVLRLYARSRESIATSIDHLALHNQVRQVALSSPKHSELNKLFRLKAEAGDLAEKDRKRFLLLVREVEKDLLENADVICCTCSGAGDARLSKFCFRHVLIDESTQATESEIMIPIVMGAKQVVLVGDHCQMGPIILNKPAEEAGYGRSLFERLLQLGHRPFRLEVQYRMHPALSEFSSNNFYEGTLQNGVTAEDRDASALFPWPNPNKPLFFYNSIHPEEISASGTSYLNRTEAALAEKMATMLLRSGVLPDQIGVITPYEGQRNYLVQYLSRQGPLGAEVYRRMEIASVDSFQGREKEFVILTCVRSNDQQGIGFLNDWRRLNVALTRARRGVMVIGNARVLSRHVLWHALLSFYQESGLVVEGSVQQLTPAKVALQKPRLTAQVFGPRSAHGLVSMYQGSIGLMGGYGGEVGPMSSMLGGPSHGGLPPGGFYRSGGGYGAVAGSYRGGDDATDSVASSDKLEPFFDLSFVPGEAPAYRQYGMPASQDSHSGWSTPSQSKGQGF